VNANISPDNHPNLYREYSIHTTHIPNKRTFVLLKKDGKKKENEMEKKKQKKNTLVPHKGLAIIYANLL